MLITRTSDNIPQFRVKHKFCGNSLFSSTINEYNKLDINIRNLKSISVFKNLLTLLQIRLSVVTTQRALLALQD